MKLDPGGRSSPVHVELDEEEIFYVLAGTGLSWQSGKTYEVRAGDTIVHRVAEEDHTLIAGPDGLDVLAFGERTNATASYLTRAGVLRMDATVKVAEDRHPWDLEADAGDLELPDPSPRPSNIVNRRRRRGRARRRVTCERRRLGADRPELGALPPGEEDAPPHCHSARRGDLRRARRLGRARAVAYAQMRALEPGRREGDPSVARRPRRLAACRQRGSRTSSARRQDGFTFLAYGTRKPSDICYYPRSNKIYFRGVGLIARLEASTTTTASRERLGGQPAQRAREDVDRERDVLLGRELVRRMADAAVEAADEQHPGVDAGRGEDARVVAGARR